MKMATTRTVLRRELTAKPGDLYMSFELGDKHWQISIGADRHGVSHYTVGVGIPTRWPTARSRLRRGARRVAAQWCTAATRPDVTAGGCTGGSPSWAWTTSLWMQRASRSTGAHGEPRRIGWTARSFWRCS